MLLDNACLHTAAHTIECLHQRNFEVLKHPLYGPDLAPYHHLFGPFSDTLGCRHFTSDQEVKEAVHAWLVIQPETFFSVGLQKLVDCWAKYVAKDGDYEETQCCCTY
jgi:hypothetical protein